jgi:hypothetical protein
MKLKMTCAAFMVIGVLLSVRSGAVQAESQAAAAPKVRLVRAVMCELIEAYEPRYIAVVFPITAGRISCYTSFDEISKVTSVHHRWFRRETLVTTKRLTIKPPNWATYSSIQLREADKGPWRVEVWQENGPLLATIRFSVTD